jgi:hypothetical protein
VCDEPGEHADDDLECRFVGDPQPIDLALLDANPREAPHRSRVRRREQMTSGTSGFFFVSLAIVDAMLATR